jgi:hypothetical protein
MAKRAKAAISINGRHGMSVKHQHSITGKVRPANSLVQVLVFSKDNKWYLQKDAKVNRRGTWTVDTTFGHPDDSGNHEYIVYAFVGDKLKEPIHEFPPAGTVGNELHVSRTE